MYELNLFQNFIGISFSTILFIIFLGLVLKKIPNTINITIGGIFLWDLFTYIQTQTSFLIEIFKFLFSAITWVIWMIENWWIFIALVEIFILGTAINEPTIFGMISRVIHLHASFIVNMVRLFTMFYNAISMLGVAVSSLASAWKIIL